MPTVSGSPSATHESSFSIGVWIYMDIGQMAPTRDRKRRRIRRRKKMDLQVDEHKWRACALRYPQAGREMAFSGQAPGAVAVFASPGGWECIHTYVVQQEQYNRFEQVAYRLLTAILLCAKLGPPKKHEVLSLRCFLIGNRTPSVPNLLVQPCAKARSGEGLMLVF